MKQSIVWLSRHPLSVSAMQSLTGLIGERSADVVFNEKNFVWAASADAEADYVANSEEWCKLLSLYNVIAGVFPPTAIEALLRFAIERPAIVSWARTGGGGFRIVSPVSIQRPDLRVGDAPIPFEFARWSILMQ